ncbi:MAG TPA: protein kinase [Gemmatimonadaceae bacterium]|nr:protein kinase [Gemmatimonadaceae bacterium]
MPSSNQDQLQTALGSSYTIERELGRGGMATVYLARDNKHGRHVALKVLHDDLAATLGPERFRREIATAAQLQHPHILGVFDSGETANGQLWFTMPFVEGQSLRDRLHREPQMPVDLVLRIVQEIAGALDYAHDQGVIHRDIKPENILLTKRGDAVLADFGIARALSHANDGSTNPAMGLTGTGLSIGTPQYMSPEQASGERALDARSDVYALGAVCYEMLAGELPFTGASAQAIIAKMLTTDAPSIRVLRPSVSPALDAVIRRALARVPADRWSSAGEFASALSSAERTTQPAPAAPPARAEQPRKRVPVSALTLGLGFLIGVGLLFAWRSKGSGGAVVVSPNGVVRLAVLPFENEGDSADGYFADGMTEAVHDKLTGLHGLEVVGTASSRQYRGTTKTPQQIGQELGVRYLLEGRVRWAKGPAGASRVRVSPELIDVNSASSKWAQPFDAPLTDVFQVQGDIAGKVAQSLQVALTPAAQQTLASRPTSDLLAYDAYLRGIALSEQGNSPLLLHRAIGAFREAVARDSSFALAWSELGHEYNLLFFNALALPAMADSADKATARALALAPDLPEAHAFRAEYFGQVVGDRRRALDEAESGLALAPNVKTLTVASNAEAQAGHWDAAAAHAAQGIALDPRDAATFGRAAQVAMWRRDSANSILWSDKARALAPENIQRIEVRAMAELQVGNLAAARKVVHDVPSSVSQPALAAYLAEYWDLGWILDSAQEATLLVLRPDSYDGDSASWAVVLAQQYSLRGDSARMRAYADTALSIFNAQVKEAPNDDQRHAFRGLSLAYLGQRAEAIREGQRAVALRPTSQDALFGPYDEQLLARVYMILGEKDKAIDLLEKLLKEPYFITPAWLRIDPTWKALRGNPRFEKLAGAKPVA